MPVSYLLYHGMDQSLMTQMPLIYTSKFYFAVLEVMLITTSNTLIRQPVEQMSVTNKFRKRGLLTRFTR